MKGDFPGFSALPHKTRFYFVRHGESESNRAGRIQGHSDSSLTDDGRDHARAAGFWFKDKPIDRFLASPLSRAWETATLIGEHIGMPNPEATDVLMELDTGILSGRSIEDLKNEDRALYNEFLVRSWEAIPGAESMDSLRRRATQLWSNLVDMACAGAKTTLCVTHGGTLQWIIKTTMAGATGSWMPVIRASNCGIFLFSAESTSLNHDTPVAPGEGFYGSWDIMNLIPYASQPGSPDPVSGA